MNINLIEMEGLLRGKCLPGDLLVGETLAEYLVRQFTAANATIHNLELKVERVVAENAGLKESLKGTVEFCYSELPETPATDAYLAEVRAQGVEMLYANRAAQWSDELLAELDAMTPEQRAEHDAGIAEFKAMLSGNSPATTDCWCRTCRPVTMTEMRFVVCPDCGNKRCPHANDHRNACTGSNEPGQEGGAYPAAAKEVKSALEMGMSRYGDAMQELAKREVKS